MRQIEISYWRALQIYYGVKSSGKLCDIETRHEAPERIEKGRQEKGRRGTRKAKDGKTIFFTAKNTKEREGRQKYLRSDQ